MRTEEEEEEEAPCLSTAADLCIKGSFAYSTPFASNYTHTYTRRCQVREFTDPPVSPARSVSGMLNEQPHATLRTRGRAPNECRRNERREERSRPPTEREREREREKEVKISLLHQSEHRSSVNTYTYTNRGVRVRETLMLLFAFYSSLMSRA